MGHSRSAEFERAINNSFAGVSGARRWTHLARDPNDPQAIAARSSVLRAAWRPAINDRVAFLVDRCQGENVLDVGCVAHDVARMDSVQWLHGRLAAVATSCLGVDVLEEGVDEMRSRGYRVLVHDLGRGLGPVAEYAPFDVIVAGELIEHVENLSMLFDVAAEALAHGGQLIVTTPNPYAPHRVRAAQLGIVWENTDHIVYAFPSGMAELAQRHGLVLAEAMVTNDSPGRQSIAQRLRSAKRRTLGRQWATVGFATLGRPRTRRVVYGPLGRLLRCMSIPGRRFTGETFIYVFQRP